tara:strand:- start:6446 stop:6979 length:534 start_codon:yes stop_codon:yes gene_type:complete
MNYNDYLNLDYILDNQTTLTQKHSELMFIVAHQSTELWFKVLIHELSVESDISIYGDPVCPDINLKRIVKIFEHLDTLWNIIATMTPDDYDSFRNELGSASGKQSEQYLKVEELLKELPNKGLFPREDLIDVENIFKKWQFNHMKTVERIIGNKRGTGGTTGVYYLKMAVDKELWKN